MAIDGYIFALISCIFHAWWNLIFKRAGGRQIFIGLTKIGEAVLFCPAFVYVLSKSPRADVEFYPLAAVGAVLTGCNYVFLSKAYRAGQLSIAYPVSRASTLLFLPLLAAVLTGQTISPFGALCIVFILAGSVLVQLGTFSQARRGLSPAFKLTSTAYALTAGLCAAAYSLWDRHAVLTLSPFVYFYGYTCFIAAGYGIWIAKMHRDEAINELRGSLLQIVQVALLNTVTYVLVLYAFRTSNVTYVIAIRQLSIAIGAFLGCYLLKEQVTAPKYVGTAVLVAGCILILFAS